MPKFFQFFKKKQIQCLGEKKELFLPAILDTNVRQDYYQRHYTFYKTFVKEIGDDYISNLKSIIFSWGKQLTEENRIEIFGYLQDIYKTQSDVAQNQIKAYSSSIGRIDHIKSASLPLNGLFSSAFSKYRDKVDLEIELFNLNLQHQEEHTSSYKVKNSPIIKLNRFKETYRLIQTQPASNKSKFIDIINDRIVKDIFDPYFDTKSIKTLLSLSKLGLKFNTQIRCLTTKRNSNKIDKLYWIDFNNELSLTLEIKTCKSSKEHRRFLILNDNQIIIIGCSLNDINKNETLVEETSQEDIDFFNTEWLDGNNYA